MCTSGHCRNDMVEITRYLCCAELRRSGDITSRLVALREKVVTLGRKYAASEHYFPLGEMKCLLCNGCIYIRDFKIILPRVRVPVLCFTCFLVHQLCIEVNASCRLNKLVALYKENLYRLSTEVGL